MRKFSSIAIAALMVTSMAAATGTNASAANDLSAKKTKHDYVYKVRPHPTGPGKRRVFPQVGNQGTPKCFTIRTNSGYQKICR